MVTVTPLVSCRGRLRGARSPFAACRSDQSNASFGKSAIAGAFHADGRDP
ncbi:MAG: hypothetical protein HY684_04770 [Chloroflexi bacterium]|nr:hypothetical protein [Chloroflexota bacterium]